MLELFFLIKVGVVAGAVMGLAAMTLNMINFTTLNLTKYVGCLLIGKSSGKANFVAGFVAHLIASACFAVLYNYLIDLFAVVINVHNAMHFAVIHTLISGSLVLSGLDRMNPCVAHGSIKPLKYFASGYGTSAIVTYVAGHVIYAGVVFLMLAA